MEDKCKEFSEQLNCGCCEQVVLTCKLNAGHAGPHVMEGNEYTTKKYRIIWEVSA